MIEAILALSIGGIMVSFGVALIAAGLKVVLQ